jgi:general secretion pathway protein C
MTDALPISLDRHFWAFNLLFILGAGYLSAGAFNLFAEEKIWPLPQAGGSIGVGQHVESMQLVTEPLARLMGMQVPAVVGLDEGASELSSEPVRSPLHAQLLATVIANRSDWSLCTLRDLAANRSSVYMVGDAFLGATVLEIRNLEVVVLNGEHREFIGIEPAGTGTPVAVAKLVADGIKKIDDRHYQIQRSTVNAALADLNKLSTEVRLLPSLKSGQANGFKVASLKADGLFSQIGIQNGDVIQSINGFDINSLDHGLEAYAKLRTAGSLDLQLERGGQPVTLHYGIQ